jgi:Fe-S-cluster containining protein
MKLPLMKPDMRIGIDHNDYGPFLDRLNTLYSAMDRKYREAADYYGFQCSGCEDNCCFTRFYHYTLLEYLYIMKGYHLLDTGKQVEVKRRSLDVCRETEKADKKGEPIRLMCPVNIAGLCLLYAYRPMICRLHGIAHELNSPGQGVLKASGCGTFTRACHLKEHFKFDRTPFYAAMAALEKELRQSVGGMHKIKMTVAEMITFLAHFSHL